MNNLLKYISQLIKGTKFEGNVFVVGGYVRDHVMNQPSKDIDLVVSLNGGGVRLAQFLAEKTESGTENNPVIYQRFGTAKFYLKGFEEEIESVMTRSEQYTSESRKPEVNYASLKEDALRRDLTINALYMDVSTGEILDPTEKGLKDINKKRIRTPLDPTETFRDDPLRMMRIIRFSCRYNWEIGYDESEAIMDNSNKIQDISIERFRDELEKILLTNSPDFGLSQLFYSDILSFVIKELEVLYDIKQNEYHEDNVLVHTLKVVKESDPDLITRLGALFHDIGKKETYSNVNGDITFHKHENVGSNITKDILKELKFPNDIIDRVSNIVRMHMRLKSAGSNGEDISDKALRKFVRDAGEDLDRILSVIHADNISHHPDHCLPDQVPEIKQRIDNLKPVPSSQHIKLPVDGVDVMNELRIKPSKKVGDVLKAVEDQLFENPDLSKEEALKIVRTFIN